MRAEQKLDEEKLKAHLYIADWMKPQSQFVSGLSQSPSSKSLHPKEYLADMIQYHAKQQEYHRKAYEDSTRALKLLEAHPEIEELIRLQREGII